MNATSGSVRIALGSDHAGYDLKERVKRFLETSQIPYDDFGAYSSDPVDYPDIAVLVSRNVIGSEATAGILICGTGLGMSIVSNKIPGIRSVVCTTVMQAELGRRHNDANILCLGARTTPYPLAIKILKAFLETPADPDERHRRRITKIHDLTNC